MKQRLVYVIIGFSVFASTLTFYFYNMFASPNILVKDNDVAVYVTIEEGTKFGAFVNDLYNKKVIHHPESFHFVATVLDYKEAMVPGKYKLEPEMTNVQAIKLLKSGKTELSDL